MKAHTASYRTITVPAGIGDNVWLLQKIYSARERFNFILPNGKPQRGKQIFDLLPYVSVSSTYGASLTYDAIKKLNIVNKKRLWSQIDDNHFYLTCNEWLEKGNNLNSFLPDLKLQSTLPWVINEHRQVVAEDVTLQQSQRRIGIYGSSYSTTRAWGFWGAKEWVTLIEKIHQIAPNVLFCLIGAEWDMDLNGDMVKILTQKRIPFYNTVGKPLGWVMALMETLDYAFYFPSGLPIVNETLDARKDCVMFYPRHLVPMMGQWASSERTKDNHLKECLFCTPEEIFNWVKDEYKLFDRL